MTFNRLGLFLFLLFTGTTAIGCSGSSENAGDQSATATPATGSTSAAPKNACALVDVAAIEAIASRTLTTLHNIESDDQTVCELSAADDNTTLVYVTVHWRGGREMARTNQTAMSMAKGLLNDGDVDIESLTGSGTVAGLADDAYYSDIMPSWVLKDDVFIEVISPLFDHEKTSQVFMSVAKTALSRL